MRKSYSKIRHIQESNMILEKRKFGLLNEQGVNPHKEGPSHKEGPAHDTQSSTITPSKEVATSIESSNTTYGDYKLSMGKISLSSPSSKEIAKISIPQGFTKTNGKWAYKDGKITLI